MDTRTKIIPLAEAASRLKNESLVAVHLDCDPLLASQSAALCDLGRPILALLTEKENSYLNLRARAELAASLAVVRYVAIGELEGALDFRKNEESWRDELEQLVISKSEAK